MSWKWRGGVKREWGERRIVAMAWESTCPSGVRSTRGKLELAAPQLDLIPLTLPLPSDPIRGKAPWQDSNPLSHTHTHSCVVPYPLPHLGLGLSIGGPGQTLGLWNKRAANVGRQGRQLEPAHAVWCYAWACGGGGHGQTKHKLWSIELFLGGTFTSYWSLVRCAVLCFCGLHL